MVSSMKKLLCNEEWGRRRRSERVERIIVHVPRFMANIYCTANTAIKPLHPTASLCYSAHGISGGRAGVEIFSFHLS